MSDESLPEVQISTRPFLGDMLTPPSTQTTPRGNAAAENPHLFAAATGRTHLHRVTEDERPLPSAPTAEVLPDNYQMPNSPAPTTRRAASVAPVTVVETLLEDVDWTVVDTLTKQLTLNEDGAGRTRAEFDVATASAAPETPFEEQSLGEMTRMVSRHAEWRVVNLGSDNEWSPRKRAQHVQAVFDNVFRYGRLQQYLREPEVEDVSVVGHDNVMVTKTTGRREQRPALAEHGSDLEQMVSDIASWRGRNFSRPGGHLDLDIGGARLSATGVPNTSVPNLTIRKHNLVDVDLDDLVGKNALTAKMKTFLTLAARANCSALIAGYPGTGKTTFLRAWMATVPWEEKIVTIETERELYLNKGPRHSQVQDLQYSPAMFAGSDVTASYSLSDAFYESLRSSAQRILFGEMRGPEAGWAMKAMQAGRGSVSTIHARSADDAIHRFADMLMSEYGLASDTVPLRQILRSIDVIIYLDFIEHPDGTRTRIVSEVAEVVPNDRGEPMAAKLFQWDWDHDTYVEPEKPSNIKLLPMLARASRVNGIPWEF